MEKNWKIKETNNKIVEELSESLGVSRTIANLLAFRGITTYNEAEFQ